MAPENETHIALPLLSGPTCLPKMARHSSRKQNRLHRKPLSANPHSPHLRASHFDLIAKRHTHSSYYILGNLTCYIVTSAPSGQFIF
ncbi:hypothetical protein LIA77_07179 [Sarocladium implicatum]|nr:hypothetical protein LIA77_07179 [Sarocladium implicatum]